MTERCGKTFRYYNTINRTAIPDLDYKDTLIGFGQEAVLTFLNGAEECEAFMVEWKESCVNPLESLDMIEEIVYTKLEGISGTTRRSRYR